MAVVPASATIIGAGAVTATARQRMAASATIIGDGSVTAHANVIARASARISGTGFVVTQAQGGQAAPSQGAIGSNFVPDPIQSETFTPSVGDYVDLIPGYNADQPNFIATLRAALNPLTSLTAFMSTIPHEFDLDTAVGTQLDQVGLWIGRDRFIASPITGVYFSWDIDNLGWEQGFWQGAFDPDDGISTLDDGTYRSLLYAKAMSNVWDSSPEAIGDMLNVLLKDQGVSAVVIDNQDMSMSVQIVGGLQNLIFRAILEGGYLPIKPEGVSLTYTVPDVTPPGNISSSITGFGSVTARANQIHAARATIIGQGNVHVDAQGGSGTGVFSGSSTIGGAGSVTATARATLLASPNIISVTGSVTANAQGRKLGAATISGAGSVTANSQVLAASTQTWSPTLHEFWIALSNQNFTASKTGNNGVYSAGGPKTFKSSGKWYWEIVFSSEVGDCAAGICNPSMSTAADYFLGSDTNSYGVYPNMDPANTIDFYNNAAQSAFGTMPYFSAGVVGRFALDCDNWKIWTAAGSGPWGGSAGGDPTTNTGGWPIPTALRTGGVGPAFVIANTSDTITADFTSPWSFTAPSGFGAM